jgi:hypothetical protein
MKNKKHLKKLHNPIFMSSESKETLGVFVFRMAVRIFLICLTVTGLCVTLAQIYHIPVWLPFVIFVSTAAVVVFNVMLLFFKKRVILLPLLFLFAFSASNILHNLFVFFDYMMHTLNSRLLPTAHLARYSPRELGLAENVHSIESAFLLICVIIALGFTFAARSRFIGIILVSSVFMFAPAFGAEIAGYASGIKIMLAGMLGIYSMWVSHTWESSDGALSLSFSDKEQDAEAKETSESLFKITPGKPPYFYKYSCNSLIAAGIALFAAFTAATVVTEAIRFDYKAILNSIDTAWNSTVGFFTPAPEVDGGGFFPSPDSEMDISMGITLNNLPEGTDPIVRVRLEDDSEKIFLRGSIGIDFDGYEWSITQDSREYRAMLRLLENFSPETEYSLLRERNERLWGGAPNFEMGLEMGLQNITIEYLARTKFLFLPTHPYNMAAVKSNPDYIWHGDTYIRADGRVRVTDFYTLYPMMSKFSEFFIDDDIPHELRHYRSLINEIYINVPENEIDNMDRLIEEATGLSGTFNTGEYYLSFNELFELISAHPVRQIHDYLRRNCAYSLETDNSVGENTRIGSFLFETKSGHCAMFASAMTLAVRRLGYPARLVTGIVTVPRGGTTQEFAKRDYHAWVEVYFDGVGWLPFDPTGGAHGQELIDRDAEAPETQASPAETTAVSPAETLPEAEAATSAVSEEGTPKEVTSEENAASTIIIVPILIVLLLLLVAGCIVILLRALKKAESAKFAGFKQAGDNKTAHELYRFMFRLLESEGFTAFTGETPLEFAERIDSQRLLRLSLGEIMPVFEKLEFGDAALTRAEYDSLYEYIAVLYNEFVLRKKLPKKLLRRIKYGR